MLVTEYLEGGNLANNIAAGRVTWYRRGKKVGGGWTRSGARHRRNRRRWYRRLWAGVELGPREGVQDTEARRQVRRCHFAALARADPALAGCARGVMHCKVC